MKSKKRIIALLTASVMLAMAACGGNGDEGEPTEEPGTEVTTTAPAATARPTPSPTPVPTPTPELPAAAAMPTGGTYIGLEDLGTFTVTGDRTLAAGGNVTFVDGKVGKAANFDGLSGLNLGKDLITKYDYSIAFWVNPAASENHTSIFYAYTGTGTSDAAWISIVPRLPAQSAASIWSHIQGSGGSHITAAAGTAPLTLNEWSHIAVTVASGVSTIYINGHAGTTLANPVHDVFSAGGANFLLGVNFWDAPFRGLIDELYIFDGKVLTQEEVVAVMNFTP
jgi:arabinan endo-1,5-alpha-L-arabinosidase